MKVKINQKIMENEFIDYSMMSGNINEWSEEKLLSEIKRYKKKLSEITKQGQKYLDNAIIFKSNIMAFDSRQKDLYFNNLRKNFVLKKDHLLLLKNLNFIYGEGYLTIDSKRPLGYSCHFEGLCEALKIDRNELSNKDEEDLYKKIDILIEELPLAIEFLVEEQLKSK